MTSETLPPARISSWERDQSGSDTGAGRLLGAGALGAGAGAAATGGADGGVGGAGGGGGTWRLYPSGGARHTPCVALGCSPY
ncbi:hypothetical protein, partial [Mycolicibacterium vinylchloridicum]|uniref:hypothetical protein n=1 Tax=Mycolicibacterium vinylchloridicum TaxID=2736928 RepID=UPI001C54AD7F